jgi:hypothetical protein
MKRIYWIAVLLPLAACCAAAQGTAEETEAIKEIKAQLDRFITQSKVISSEGMIFSGDVTGAPYAADEITEFSQTLGDGTHIQRESKVAVYRDGQGRVRHETPDEIIIADPTAHVSYSLNPKTMKARKMAVLIKLPTATANATVAASQVAALAAQRAMVAAERSMMIARAKAGEGTGASAQGLADAESGLSTAVKMAMEAKIKADQEAAQKAQVLVGSTYTIGGGGPVMFTRSTAGEPIGQQLVEGVLCDGTRSVETIAAGSIGNDRPIQTVYERWYSSDLKTTVRTVRSDPRTGEETFRLTNIRRDEPSPELFQVPAGYKIQ